MQPMVQGMLRGLRRLQLVMLITVAAGTAGCTPIADRMASRFADRSVKAEHDLKVIEGEISLYRQCLESRGGVCEGNASTALPQAETASAQVVPLQTSLSAPVASAVAALGPNHPAQAGAAVLKHPFLQKLIALHNHLRGVPSSAPVSGVEAAFTGSTEAPETTLTLSISAAEVGDFVDQVNQATASGAWPALSEQAEKQAAALNPSDSGASAAQQDARNAAFIRRYMEAYFENGKFMQVELDTSDLDTKIESYLSSNAPLLCGASADGCESLVTALQNEILQGITKDSANQEYMLLALGTQGFVSRMGDPLSFPGVQITFDPAGVRPATVGTIDMTKVGTDLVSVFLQALFDAHEGLPAVSQATGVDLGAKDEAFDLPVFNPAVGNVSEQDFQDIKTFSNQVSASVGVAFNRIIRGIGPFSLNNEALEDLLTTAVTVTVQNAAQRGAWCWFSCKLDQEAKGAAANEKERIRSDLTKTAKRIKLRLRLL